MAKKPQKPYWEMNTRELAEATKEFDREFVGDTFRQPTAKEREQLLRARRKSGRPNVEKVGAVAERVSVSIERSLLRDADVLAKAQNMSRSRLIAEGLQALLAKKRRLAGQAQQAK